MRIAKLLMAFIFIYLHNCEREIQIIHSTYACNFIHIIQKTNTTTPFKLKSKNHS